MFGTGRWQKRSEIGPRRPALSVLAESSFILQVPKSDIPRQEEPRIRVDGGLAIVARPPFP